MRAVRLYAAGEPLRVEEVRDPEPHGTQVLVRVAGCGVCRTDVHISEGIQPRVELPLTLGHEVAGWIGEAGAESGTALRSAGIGPGDAVLVFGGWGCGRCAECRGGEEQRCLSGRAAGFQADGGYADLLLVPHPRHLVPLGRLDPVEAAPLADAGVTPYRAVRRATPWLTPGARVLQIGCGALGTFALQHLRRLPSGPDLRIAVRELDPRRIELATELGADVGLLAADDRLIREALGGPPDVVLDLVGTDGTLALASTVVAPGGLIMLVGEAGGRVEVGFSRPAVESWVTTTTWGSLQDLHDVVDAARRRRLHWQVERMPLVEAASALERLRSGDASRRIVLVP